MVGIAATQALGLAEAPGMFRVYWPVGWLLNTDLDMPGTGRTFQPTAAQAVAVLRAAAAGKAPGAVAAGWTTE